MYKNRANTYGEQKGLFRFSTYNQNLWASKIYKFCFKYFALNDQADLFYKILWRKTPFYTYPPFYKVAILPSLYTRTANYSEKCKSPITGDYNQRKKSKCGLQINKSDFKRAVGHNGIGRKKCRLLFRQWHFSLLIHANTGSGKIRKLVTATYTRTMGTRAWQCAHMDASMQWIRVGSPADLPFMMPATPRLNPLPSRTYNNTAHNYCAGRTVYRWRHTSCTAAIFYILEVPKMFG